MQVEPGMGTCHYGIKWPTPSDAGIGNRVTCEVGTQLAATNFAAVPRPRSIERS